MPLRRLGRAPPPAPALDAPSARKCSSPRVTSSTMEVAPACSAEPSESSSTASAGETDRMTEPTRRITRVVAAVAVAAVAGDAKGASGRGVDVSSRGVKGVTAGVKGASPPPATAPPRFVMDSTTWAYSGANR